MLPTPERIIPSPSPLPTPRMPIHIKPLGTLLLDNISNLAFGERDLGLLLIEIVIRGIQCFRKAVDFTARMQLVPWIPAGVSLARLKHQHESVKSIHDLRQLTVGNAIVVVFGWVSGQIDRLGWIVLGRLSDLVHVFHRPGAALTFKL